MDNGNIAIKIYSQQGEVMLAACDEGLLDKKFEDSDSFYKKEIEDEVNQKTLKDFSKKNNSIKIIVDNREYRSNVVRNLAVKGTSVEPQQLDVGDYVLSSRIGVSRGL